MARSETTRDSFTLASLSSVPLDNEGGECYAMIVTLDKGKTIITGRTQYGGAIRAREPEDCCLGALAQWLFWRWQVNGERPPDFNSRSDWYNQRVFPAASSREKGFSWETQSLWHKRVFQAVGITTSKLTHTMRGSAAKMADLMGLEADEVGPASSFILSILLTSIYALQILRAGRWKRGALHSYYLSFLPRVWMRAAAGWPREGRCFHLKRAVVPPEALMREIFPWVDDWLERYQVANRSGARFAEGGLDNDPDLSGEVLLRLLSLLREIFLQDAAVLQARYPDNPLWLHGFGAWKDKREHIGWVRML